MIHEKEIVNEPQGKIKIHLSENAIAASPFSIARIKQGGYGLLEKDFWIQRVANRGFHVFFVTLSGMGEITLEDGTVLTLKKGDGFISWATGQGHYEHTISEEPWEMVWITIWEDSPRLKPTSLDWELREVSEANCNLLKTAINNIIEEDSYNDSKSVEAITCHEALFLIYLERAFGITEDAEHSHHRAELATLWKKVANEPNEHWTLKKLSEVSGFSKAHLTRLCHLLYDKSPGKIVSELLLKQARIYLKNSDLTIGEISERLGFSSVASFSTAFKDYTGMSPREYKKDKTYQTDKTDLFHP